MAAAIGSFENASGHHYQSATESSWNTWSTGSGIGGDRNTTISYYNNGAMLGAMLDLKIRAGSQNRKSLDDVMRGLYKKYYLEKKRGFTDAEFRQECESAAGGGMAEVFEYAATTKEVDYAKYFALAGLKLDSTAAEEPGAYLGVDTHTQELPPSAVPVGGGRGAAGGGRAGQAIGAAAGGAARGGGGGGRGRGGVPMTQLAVTDVAAGSPAEAAGLKAGDLILEVDGSAAATAAVLNDALTAKKAGDKIKLRISRGGPEQQIEATLVGNVKKTYSLAPMAGVTNAQSGILNSWLRAGQ
jgi:predicted metalloprotease with PDZ domain